MEQEIGRNLALELVRVTEAAALTAGRWMGRGQKEAADQAAVDAMRMVLNTIPMDGVVVIGEGAKDKAPMLFEGEHLGCADEPKTDIAVDPIDGTRLALAGDGELDLDGCRLRTRLHVRVAVRRLHGQDRRRS